MNASTGFSTTEFLLYIGVMTMIIGSTSVALVYDYLRTHAALAVIHESCMLSTACDVWAHDMYQASDERTLWYQPDAHAVIVQSNRTDVGWLVKKERLLRISGVYDRNRQQWVKKTTSVMATGVTECRFTSLPDAQNNQRIQAVCGEIVGKKSRVTRTVTLRNGTVCE